MYDRFTAYADVPELLLNFCPPGLDVTDEESFQQCFTYDAADERDVIAALPEVEAASRGSFRGLTLAPLDDPDDTWMASALAMLDPGIMSADGPLPDHPGSSGDR